MENKVLGKGLSALITKNPLHGKETSNLDMGQEAAKLKTTSILPNRFQPRKHYDEAAIEELKSSIKENGILQPIIVRKHGDNYEVVAGERRLRAAKAIGLEEVPVVIKNVSDKDAFVLALVENIQREELNAIEEALGFKRLLDEFQYSQDDIAKSVGKDRSTVTNLLRLLKLPDEIQQQVAGGKLSMGHARALLSLEGASIQKKMAQVIMEKGLSVRQVEDLVAKVHKGETLAHAARLKPRNRDIEILEDELQRLLGTKVMVKDKKGKGKIVVEYYTLDDLDRILGILRK